MPTTTEVAAALRNAAAEAAQWDGVRTLPSSDIGRVVGHTSPS